MTKSKKFILWFSEIGMKDLALVGGKNASLGEMYRKLTKKGIHIPNGFAVTSYAYKNFLKKTGAGIKVKEILKGLDARNIKNLKEKGRRIRAEILKAELPEELKEAIKKAYQQLCRYYQRELLDVAVRSSATAEDAPTASFAGQLETYLNIRGENQLLGVVKKSFASLFTDRVIFYRADKSISQIKSFISVGVQKMVRSDLASAGVGFSLDTETGFMDVDVIDASYGLGENVVKGVVTPDEYFVFEPLLRSTHQGKLYKPIISKTLGTKEKKLVYAKTKGKTTQNVKVPLKARRKFVLTDEEILTLARWIVLIEDYYKRPMDVEWAKDGLDGKLYIVQARPETVHSQKDWTVLEEYKLGKKGKVLVTGQAIGDKIGQGRTNVIQDVKDIAKFKPGQVLVTRMTDPDWLVAMKIAKAIVTDAGGRTCHAAIVSRELGIPCVVGTGNATEVIKPKQNITVSCAEGGEGKVYQGILSFKIKKIDLKHFEKPKTKIMMNLGNPEQAFGFSFIPNDGIGLAREEFIISNYIGIHPLALINFKKLGDKKVKEKIKQLTYGWRDKTQFFVDKLAEGIGRIAAAFYPREVIVRTSDFKTSEYASLVGGKDFEPKEANPMIGWRGASRYTDPKFEPAFGLECKAIKKVREVMGLKNVKVMIPFCRTPEEGKKVLKIMAKYGLAQGKDGLEVYVMAEVPSNIWLADEFAQIFDGFSLGTNDLTQLTLGLDRDSALVAHIFDERDEAVKRSVAHLIKTAHKYKKKVGICGDAPSSYPDFAQFLVECGIDSISLSPDAVIKTTLSILKKERELKRKKGRE